MERENAKFKARQIVSDRLREFFAAIQEQFGKSSEEFWRGVESKLGGRARAPRKANPGDRDPETK